MNLTFLLLLLAVSFEATQAKDALRAGDVRALQVELSMSSDLSTAFAGIQAADDAGLGSKSSKSPPASSGKCDGIIKSGKSSKVKKYCNTNCGFCIAVEALILEKKCWELEDSWESEDSSCLVLSDFETLMYQCYDLFWDFYFADCEWLAYYGECGEGCFQGNYGSESASSVEVFSGESRHSPKMEALHEKILARRSAGSTV